MFVTFLGKFYKPYKRFSVKFGVLTYRKICEKISRLYLHLKKSFTVVCSAPSRVDGCVQVTTDPDPGDVIRNTAVHDSRCVLPGMLMVASGSVDCSGASNSSEARYKSYLNNSKIIQT
jgi:hypothetical protein